MTEPDAAREVRLVEHPFVSIAALEAVRALLDDTRRSSDADRGY
jgi:hypothetical protein